MRYLEFSTVLPLGSPEPDISSQPSLKDYMTPALWEQRVLHLSVEKPAGPAGKNQDRDERTFIQACKQWLDDVQQHTERIEQQNGIEYCNWSVHTSDAPTDQHILRITYAHDFEREELLFTPAGVRALLDNPAALAGLPGWTESSLTQQEALTNALRQHLQRSTMSSPELNT